MTTILAAEGVSGIANDLGSLFEFAPLFFEGTPFALNRTGLLYLLSAVIIFAVMARALGNGQVVPGRLQLAVENVVLFVRNNIAIDVIGPQGARYAPMLTAMFLFIWVNNLYEVTPGVNFPTTSRMAVPAMLAMMSWALFIFAGVGRHGLRYFLDAIKPSGVPGFVLPLIIPIELVSTFIVRPLTLAVRLFANLMAGHIILAIVFVSANSFLFDVANRDFAPGGFLGVILGIFLAFAAGPLVVVFEIVVATIQAYIFTILTAVYINSSLSHH